MFESLGRLMFRRRRWVLAAAGIFVVVAALWGTGVFGSLGGAGFEDPNSDSARAARQARQVFGRHQADVVVLYHSPTLTVDDPAFRTAVQRTLSALPDRYVAKVITSWDTKAPQMVSTDRHSTYAVLELAGADGDARKEALAAVEDKVAAPGLSTRVGGEVAVGRDGDTQVARDIARAERLSLPLLLVLLWWCSGRWPRRACRCWWAGWPSSAPSPCCGWSPWSPTCRCSPSTWSPCWAWAWPSTTRCSSSAASARSWPPSPPDARAWRPR
jgi:uncharacterized membrane protein YdfJ with MMPL/SSD domain